ncbi:hypothetical protein [Sphingobium mellinum]|uniref:hypothetical protein n=1 Tax=Sphingobium mellinum TaxID=1387166 RepID=UPI0030ED69C5
MADLVIAILPFYYPISIRRHSAGPMHNLNIYMYDNHSVGRLAKSGTAESRTKLKTSALPKQFVLKSIANAPRTLAQHRDILETGSESWRSKIGEVA